MTDAQTISVYDREANAYAARFDAGETDRHVGVFMSALPKAAQVLDLGCGPGRAAAAMQAAGHRVLGIDASAEMVQLAKAAGVDARCMTFDDMPRLHGPFDGVWANFSLLHAPRAALPDHLAAIAGLMRKDGLFHMGMKTGTGSQRDGIGRKYTYYDADELAQLLKDAGFAELARSTGAETGLDGTRADWVIILSRYA